MSTLSQKRVVRRVSIGVLILTSVFVPCNAYARDREYTVSKGKVVEIGPWYLIESCKEFGLAHVKVLERPSHGTLRIYSDEGPPTVSQQIAYCGDQVILHRAWISYTSKRPGNDHFEFFVEYDHPIAGDWTYSVTVHVMP